MCPLSPRCGGRGGLPGAVWGFLGKHVHCHDPATGLPRPWCRPSGNARAAGSSRPSPCSLSQWAPGPSGGLCRARPKQTPARPAVPGRPCLGGFSPRAVTSRPMDRFALDSLSGTTGTLLTCPPVQFKESALRKQSLYLKFDPLLNDSPQRAAPTAAETHRYAFSVSVRHPSEPSRPLDSGLRGAPRVQDSSAGPHVSGALSQETATGAAQPPTACAE